MTYWLCITIGDNWKIIKQKNIRGVSERYKNTITKVKIGDKLLIYVKQKRRNELRVVAIYEAISNVFKDTPKIFKTPKGMGNKTFPFRIKLKSVKIFEKPIQFKPLIPKLKFITNKQKWSIHLMGKAMREIPEEDFNLIIMEAQ